MLVYLVNDVQDASGLTNAGTPVDTTSAEYTRLAGLGGQFLPGNTPGVETGASAALVSQRNAAARQQLIMLALGASRDILGGAAVCWRPDGLGDATTWYDVMRVVDAHAGPITIYCPQPTTYVVEPGPAPAAPVVWDLKGSVIVGKPGPHDSLPVQIRRGATLHNLAGIGGVRLQHSKQAGDPPALTFSPITPGVAPVFTVRDGAELKSLSNATDMMFTLGAGEFYLVFKDLGTAQADGPYPVVAAGPGALLKIVVLTGGLSLDTVQPPNWIGSDAAALVGWMHDGSMTFPQGFWTVYHPNNSGTNFNMALGQGGGMGPTAYRPVDQATAPNPSVGCMYFDTDVGTPVWWSGSAWVDATGTPA
jgi:hypothetical protein